MYFDIIRNMKRIVLAFLLLFMVAIPARAEMVSPEATLSGEIATPSGIVEKRVEEKTDLTQPTGETKNKLERVLEENPVGELSWNNFLRYSITHAVKNGVPVNTVVLILLFPLVVAMVTAARHLIGVRGAGILTPALLSVAFLATGIWAGVVLFLIILIVTVLGY